MINKLLRATAEAAHGLKAYALYYSGAYLKALEKRENGLVVLAYHSVTSGPVTHKGLQVGADNFKKQLKWLSEHFEILPLDTAIKELAEITEKGRNVLSLTFDDGYLDNLKVALPILQNEGVKGSIFLTTGPVEKSDFMWNHKLQLALNNTALNCVVFKGDTLDTSSPKARRAALKQLKADFKAAPPKIRDQELACLLAELGFDNALAKDFRMLTPAQVTSMSEEGTFTFHNHTDTHPVVASISDGDLVEELSRSREKLISWTGTEGQYFAYPFGGASDYNTQSVRIVEELGFQRSFTLNRGTNDIFTPAHEMKRIPVKDFSLPVFIDFLLDYI